MACLISSPEGIQQKKVCFAQGKARETSRETVERDKRGAGSSEPRAVGKKCTSSRFLGMPADPKAQTCTASHLQHHSLVSPQ